MGEVPRYLQSRQTPWYGRPEARRACGGGSRDQPLSAPISARPDRVRDFVKSLDYDFVKSLPTSPGLLLLGLHGFSLHFFFELGPFPHLRCRFGLILFVDRGLRLLRVQDSGIRDQDVRFRVQGLGHTQLLLRGACPQKVQGYLALRNTPLLGPYSRTVPRVLRWS